MGTHKNVAIEKTERKRERQKKEYVSVERLEALITYFSTLLAVASMEQCRMGIGVDGAGKRLMISAYYRGQSYVTRLSAEEHDYEKVLEELDLPESLVDEICEALAKRAVSLERQGEPTPQWVQSSF